MDIRTVDKQLKKLKMQKHTLARVLAEYGIDCNIIGKDKFQTDCTELKKLKVAAVMDPFTVGNFRSECELFEITSDDWFNQLEECKPDLFFLESTWHGKNDSWFKKVSTGSKELYEMTNYCHEKGIPVIFWNKEDPVHTDVFMAAASCADLVFTTDYDCIERYIRTLQHTNVYFLSFSAQPVVHNPIEIHNRKDKFCYAGTYFHRYKERSRVFDAFADAIEKRNGMEIYDRNYGSGNLQYAFPARYNKMIMGKLEPDDIHIAYKGYNYGINTCTVSQSQTMFARRGYELLASNTVTVGNFSLGVKNILGDLAISTDNADEMIAQLDRFCATPEMYRKYRLAGLREVMKYHLCEDRLGYIAEKVFGKDMKKPMPYVTVVSSAQTQDEKDRVTASFNRQTYDKKKLVFTNGENITVENGFVAAFSPDDYYGENYLTDLILSVRYSDAEGFGKLHFYTKDENGFVLNGTEGTYKPCNTLFSTRAVVKAEKIADIKEFASGTEIQGDFLAVDEFNYCKNCVDDECEKVDDLYIDDKGIPLEKIELAIQKIKENAMETDIVSLSSKEMADSVAAKVKSVETSYLAGKFKVLSTLADDKSEYIMFRQRFDVSEFNDTGKISVAFYGTGDLAARGFCIFYNAMGEKISASGGVCNRVLNFEIPSNAKTFSLAIKVSGAGLREFTETVVSGNLDNGTSTPLLTKSDTLVISDYYPSYEELYNHMFVHKRNLLYRQSGLVTDTMCINMRDEAGFREFDNINIANGGADRIASAINSGQIRTVCVHFLSPVIWSALKNNLDKINLIIWSHGSDIQPWHRRKYNYTTEEQIASAKEASEKREALWKEVFEYSEKYNIHFVYVSEFFKKQIEEDYGVNLDGRCSIIHNCIDTDLFSYEKKDPGQRFNIMSVKSFSTLTYANDITQKAIEILSSEKEFSQMTFDLYGDGERFEQDTANLKKFSNVHLHRGFLTQPQIAQLHKTHGIYIATTRMDTQGVSRDEAMSSGLVPVTNDVAAIREFTDDECAVIAPPEDAKAIAEGILKLVRNPDLFMQMSAKAAEKVRSLSAKELTADKEILLIESRNKND